MKLKKAGLAILTGSILMSTLYGCGGNPEGVADNSQKNNKDVSQNTVQSQGETVHSQQVKQQISQLS